MIVQFTDGAVGTPVYINPDYVISVRPEPSEPERFSVVKLKDGETLRVLGDHREVFSKLESLQ